MYNDCSKLNNRIKKRVIHYRDIFFLFSYELVRSCWAESPEDRPSFKDLVRSITLLLGPDDEDGSVEDDDSVTAETSFVSSLLCQTRRPDDGSVKCHEIEDPDGQGVERESPEPSDDEDEEFKSVTTPEYLVIVESPMLLGCESIVDYMGMNWIKTCISWQNRYVGDRKWDCLLKITSFKQCNFSCRTRSGVLLFFIRTQCAIHGLARRVAHHGKYQYCPL